MLEIKGFVSVRHYADNQPKATARIGELSPIGKTVSRDIKVHVTQDRPEVAFNLFSSRMATDVSYVEPAQQQIDTILEVALWVVDQGGLKIAGPDVPSYISNLDRQFGTLGGTFYIGEIVKFDDGWYPTFVTVEMADWSFRIWFADREFVNQYDEFEIEVVAPVAVIDDLMQGYNQVKPLLEESTDTSMVNKVSDIEKDDPATLTKGREYVWYDPSGIQDLNLRCGFAVVIYGMGGNTVDNIRNALVDFILTRSQYDRNAWAKVLPELFSPNEMIFTPRWNSVLESYDPLDDDIYATVARPRDLENLAVEYTPELPEMHIRDTVESVPTLWRGITTVAVPSKPLSGREPIPFSKLYPDYILVPSLMPDFSRMSPETREFIQVFHLLLTHASTWNEYSALPPELSKTIRDGKVFVTATLSGWMYHVLVRDSFNIVE